MNHLRLDPVRASVVGLLSSLILFAFFPAVELRGQSQKETPTDLIKQLGYRSSNDPLNVGFTCGELTTDAAQRRVTAESLVTAGQAASPEIEKALDSVERTGAKSQFALGAGWLMLVYAKVKGPQAFPRLQRMLGNPALDFVHYTDDNAIALSLDLTAYVDRSRNPSEVICRPLVPRDGLNDLILAWERNDRAGLERDLGPAAKEALKALLNDRTWDNMRADLWRSRIGRKAAVGYQFDAAGQWSDPEETLNPARVPAEGARTEYPAAADIQTRFVDAHGRNCGTRRVKFIRTQDKGTLLWRYLIDNPDLRDLLGLISSCAADTR